MKDRAHLYILRGHRPVPTFVVREWANWMEGSMEQRTVAKTEIGAVLVSTVFLGIDHNFTGQGPPIVFETMAFRKRRALDIQQRYFTWQEAEIGHAEVVERVKRGEVSARRQRKRAKVWD